MGKFEGIPSREAVARSRSRLGRPTTTAYLPPAPAPVPPQATTPAPARPHERRAA